MTHCSGWKAVREVCLAAKVKKPHKITAIRMRHRISTKFSLVNVDPAEKEAVLRHMGHGSSISANIYQCPPSYLEVCKVGRHLLDFEGQSDQQVVSAIGPSESVSVEAVDSASESTQGLSNEGNYGTLNFVFVLLIATSLHHSFLV